MNGVTEMRCPICKQEASVLSGESGHDSNWYCNSCGWKAWHQPAKYYSEKFDVQLKVEQNFNTRVNQLQLENIELREKMAMTCGVGSGGGCLFVHGDFDSIKAVQAIVLNNEKLRQKITDAENCLVCASIGDPMEIAQTALDILTHK